MLKGTGKRLIPLFYILLVSISGLSAQSLSLSAELEQEQIWLGDSVRLTLYLQGSENSISPDLVIPSVDVEKLGGTVRSSKSITNINGKVTEDVREAYVFGYKLTPEKAGRIIIPAVEVNIEGRKLSTQQLVLTVMEPQKADGFELKLDFDRKKVYLNEACRLKVSFYYEKSLRSLEIRIPGLESLSVESAPGTTSNERYEINLNGKTVIFSRDDNGGVSGLSAVFTLRPDTVGPMVFNNATASFESVTGYQRVQDFFGRIQRQEVYGRSVISGNHVAVDVLPFPEDGRPDDFFGLSGKIRLDLSVSPTEVHIGDPMTLNLTISGMNNTDLDIPPLSRYLGAGIDIPDTRSSAKVEGSSKTITQTIRIKEPAIQLVPPVKFSYFDSETGSYEYASSKAVPIKVLDTKVITVSELEGGESSGPEKRKITLEKTREGIYYNYSGKQLLEAERPVAGMLAGPVLIKILLFLPPAIFLVFLIYSVLLPQVRAKANARADRSRALKALGKSAGHLDKSDPKLFLGEFNRMLAAFLKVHGTDDDMKRLDGPLGVINAVLYGRRVITSEQASEETAAVIDVLKSKRVDADE